MNTIKRHNEQILSVLLFLANAGFTTAFLLQLVAGRERRGLPTQLLKLGLILSRDMHHGLTIFGLSKKGADLIGAKKINLHKIRLGRVEHALIAQHQTLISKGDFNIESFEFEPQKFARNTRPDAVWQTKEGHKVHVEVELNGKSMPDGEMDRFFQKVLSRETIVVFQDSALLGRYLVHARRYADHGIPNWVMDNKQWFKTGGVTLVDMKDWKHVYFREVGCSEMSIWSYFDEGLI